MGAVERPDGFNALPDDAAEAALQACCSSRAWVRDVLAGRPYGSADALFAAADAALAGMDERDVDDALAGHPRIGDEPDSASSRREQSGLVGVDQDTLGRLAEANRRYEERFGHVYLVCATGRTAAEMLAIARDRLGNDPVTERRVTRTELEKINRIRLESLLGS
ncbi:MAG: 2-oxo-4-hydroxy-4-carboxy-5-ureidoimidazoline decarboxylase [Jiangellaceae bacterium]